MADTSVEKPLTLGLDIGNSSEFHWQKWSNMFIRILDKCGEDNVEDMLLIMSYVMTDRNLHDKMIKSMELCIQEINLDVLRRKENQDIK